MTGSVSGYFVFRKDLFVLADEVLAEDGEESAAIEEGRGSLREKAKRLRGREGARKPSESPDSGSLPSDARINVLLARSSSVQRSHLLQVIIFPQCTLLVYFNYLQFHCYVFCAST